MMRRINGKRTTNKIILLMVFLTSLSTIFIILIVMNLKSVANTYKPEQREEQQQTQSTTNRGCSQSVARFQLLAPSTLIGKTTLEQPIFFFWISHPSQHELKISVTQPFVETALWESRMNLEKPGFFPLKMPKYLELKDDEYYILTAELPCSEQADSGSFIRVVFQKVAFKNTTPSKSLAEPEFWYDDLVESFQESSTEFEHLLNQMGIHLTDENF